MLFSCTKDDLHHFSSHVSHLAIRLCRAEKADESPRLRPRELPREPPREPPIEPPRPKPLSFLPIEKPMSSVELPNELATDVISFKL